MSTTGRAVFKAGAGSLAGTVAQIRNAADKAAGVAGEFVRGEAVENTPREEGTLRRSAAVTVMRGENRAAVSFDTPYAVVQHEDMTLRHKEGGPKFLENAANGNRDRVLEIMGASMRGEFQ